MGGFLLSDIFALRVLLEVSAAKGSLLSAQTESRRGLHPMGGFLVAKFAVICYNKLT